jgi:hypothetical protein
MKIGDKVTCVDAAQYQIGILNGTRGDLIEGNTYEIVDTFNNADCVKVKDGDKLIDMWMVHERFEVVK